MYANNHNLSLTSYAAERPFRQSVAKIPSERTVQDLTIINTYLKHLEALSTLRESHIRQLCKTVRYEIRDTHHVLFSRGDLNTCWYILLSGSVFIESTMYLPRASFGKRTPANPYRLNECVILEPSELLVIDYPSLEPKEPLLRIDHQEQERSIIDDDDEQLQTMTLNRKKSSRIRQRSSTVSNSNDIHSSMIRSSHSRASDTSSAYSGSDIMQSSTNGDDCLMNNNETDDESEGSSEHSFPIRDHIREVLMKEANERTDDDIETILEFLHHFPAFADLTLHVRRELCKVLVYAQVEKAQTVVMNDGERYDSWSVIINGVIDDETIHGEPIRTLTVGQSFGCGATLDQYCHKGIMKTRVDDCQFVVVAQNDYYAILNQGEKDVRKIEENGQVVMMKEVRVDDEVHRIPREVVIKATVGKLLDLLVDERQLSDDPNFVEDFLLTYRTFINDPTIVSNKLLDYFHKNHNLSTSEHIARVILSWVNNHYNDFETNAKLNEFLEKFDDQLQHHDGECMRSWKYLLNLACFTRASVRTLTITRSTRDDVLNFNILGGSDTLTNNGIFVSKVERNSKAYEAGLRRGDQILNVNGQCFDYLTHARALEILRGSTHLSLTVKNNLMGFNEIINPEKSPARKKRHDISLYEQEIRNKLNGSSPIRSYSTAASPILPMSPTETFHHQARSPLTTITTPTKNIPTNSEKIKPRPLTKRMGLKRAVMQKLKITKNNSEFDIIGTDNALDSSVSSISNSNKSLNRSSSNPDLSSSSISNKSITSSTSTFSGTINDEDNLTFVVKVYRSDQSFKYFPVLKSTTAKQLVMLSITEFSIVDQSRYYSLCEVSVENNVIKQKRLPDHIDNLPERLSINARYYLKNNHSTETLVPDHLSNELIREARIYFLQLDALEICAQLTLRDFAIFKSVQPTEYIDHIFKLKSSYGIPHLEKFLRLPNQEMYWTITEIIRERNLMQRSKTIKHFIKIAKCCKDMKNFNSMFAIVGGLDHKAVQRLQASWERVPDKYKKLFEELKSLLAVSRNMSVYRNLLKNEFIMPPIIPMFPLCMKDLTFIHLGNQTQDKDLINFEKLRMIAKEIRYIGHMSSSPYDISNMFDSPASHAQVFAGFGHQSATDSHGTIRRHQTGMRLSIAANAKRTYDEALMIKKVKTYLNNAEIIEDEDRLLELANQCEPGGHASTSSRKLSLVERLSFDDHHDKTGLTTKDRGPMNVALQRGRIHSTPANFVSLKTALLQNVSTLKRRPSPSTSSLSSNSSCDRRGGSIQLTKFESFSGTQSPDAVNKLLRLSDSTHQIKSRAPQKPTPVLRSASPLISNSVTLTGLTSTSELTQRRYQHQVTKMRDANKLTSESSSLNLKPASSVLYVRSHLKTDHPASNEMPKNGDANESILKLKDTAIGGRGHDPITTTVIGDGYASLKNRTRTVLPQTNPETANTDGHRPVITRTWIKRSKSQNELNVDQEESAADYDDQEQVTAV